MGVKSLPGPASNVLQPGFEAGQTLAASLTTPVSRALFLFAIVERRHGTLVRKIAGFLVSGGIGFIVDFTAFMFMTQVFRLPGLAARPLAIVIAIAITFMLNRTFTFIRHDRRAIPVTFLRYLAASLLGASCNIATFTMVSVSVPALPALLPFACGVAAGLIINFLLYDRVVFLLRRTG